MNLNPFVYHHKVYDNCPLATMLSRFLGAMQRVFLLCGVLIAFIVVVDHIPNWGEALIGSSVFLVLYLILRLFRHSWTDKLAIKEAERNS